MNSFGRHPAEVQDGEVKITALASDNNAVWTLFTDVSRQSSEVHQASSLPAAGTPEFDCGYLQ